MIVVQQFASPKNVAKTKFYVHTPIFNEKCKMTGILLCIIIYYYYYFIFCLCITKCKGNLEYLIK